MPFDRPPSPASVSRLKCFALHSLLLRADLAWRLGGVGGLVGAALRPLG